MVDIPSDGHAWLPHNIVNRSPIVSFWLSPNLPMACLKISAKFCSASVTFPQPQGNQHYKTKGYNLLSIQCEKCSITDEFSSGDSNR